MTTWYPIIVNILIGSIMTLIGFKVYIPKFKSDDAREKFYANWSLFFKIGGILMTIWGFYQLANAM